MTIQDGYGGQPTDIRIDARPDQEHTKLEVWVEHYSTNLETLSYATIEEMVALRDEINKALKEALGI